LLHSLFLFDHFNIFFRADNRAVTAALTIIIIAIISVLSFPVNAGFRADGKAEFAADTILLQEFRPHFNAP
jgi:hypothetical protein